MKPHEDTPASTPSLRVLFDSLVDLDVTDRARRLSELDPDAQRALRALLDGDAHQLPLLSVPAAEVVNQWQDTEGLAQRFVGRQIGPFRIMQQLGQGGTALVFRAERAAGEGTQAVALKLLHSGLFSSESERRFAREHAILAQLTHPNIARLIEGGVSDEGVPYIAMELVDGAPITEHADARALPVRARLALMATLCRAIEAAHAALVVHRDLKPSNVFVDRGGAIKVLDFGIAKLLGDEALQAPTQAIMLTPEYAAPEQFKPGPVTTAADVYALGVLLGELLTGRLLSGANPVRASVALETSDTRPPQGLPPRDHLARQLRGDLDSITATALADEPSLRYRSAGAMADDIERHLDGRPVQAHPPSRWYRARKFVHRHRGGVLTAAALTLAMLAGLGLALWQAQVAHRAAIAATAEAARANSMRDFMFDAFAQTEPGTPQATDATVIEVVERAIVTANADRVADPRARIELLTHLARVLGARGKVERAAQLLDTTQQNAAKELRIGDALMIHLELAILENLSDRGELDEARTRTDALLKILPTDAISQRVETLARSAWIASRRREFDRGVAEGTEAVLLARKLGDADLLQSSLRGLGSTLLEADRAPEAIVLYEELLAMQRARFGDAHVRVAAEEAALSRAYRRNGELVRAEQHARAAVAIDDRAMPPDHPHRALHLNALVMVLSERRAYDQTLEPLLETVRIQSLSASNEDLALSYGSLGQMRGALGDWPAALTATRQALDILVAKGAGNSYLGIRLRTNVGYALAMNGQRAAAEAELDHALRDAQASAKPDPERIGNILANRVRIALDADDRVSANVHMDTLAGLRQSLSKRAMWPGRIETLRAELLLADGKVQEAQETLTSAALEFGTGVRVDPVVETEHALLLAIAAQRSGADERVDALRARAHDRLAALRFPPPYIVRLAALAAQD